MFGSIVTASFTCCLISDSTVVVALGMKAVITMLHTITKPANPQVAFSRKSVVLRTPMIWLEEENPEAKPPPFEFWINTIKIKSIEAIRIRIEINTYIFVLFFSVSNQLFQKSNLVRKVSVFFRIIQI